MDTITNIPVSSLTYALKGQKVLERYGYKAWAGRDHNRVSGCGYQLTVRGDPEKAKELLESGQFNVNEVSARTGYKSSQYFSITFRRYMGYSPSEAEAHKGE